MRRIVVAVLLVSACFTMGALPDTTPPDVQVLKIGVYKDLHDGSVVFVRDAWKIVKVGSYEAGTLPLNGCPNGVRITILVSEVK